MLQGRYASCLVFTTHTLHPHYKTQAFDSYKSAFRDAYSSGLTVPPESVTVSSVRCNGADFKQATVADGVATAMKVTAAVEKATGTAVRVGDGRDRPAAGGRKPSPDDADAGADADFTGAFADGVKRRLIEAGGGGRLRVGGEGRGGVHMQSAKLNMTTAFTVVVPKGELSFFQLIPPARSACACHHCRQSHCIRTA